MTHAEAPTLLLDPSLTAIALLFIIASAIYLPSSSMSISVVANVIVGGPINMRSCRETGIIGGLFMAKAVHFMR
eukprot:2512502-Ditylum_brightwellii.AAC.1